MTVSTYNRQISECSSGVVVTLSLIIDSEDNANSVCVCVQFLKRFKQGFNLHPNTIGGLE